MIDEKVMSVAVSVGRKTARNWPMIDAEDITQEILLKACTRADEYNALSMAECFVSLEREAVAYCARERADYITSTARYLYTPTEVRVLLDVWAESGATYAVPPSRDGYVAAPDAGNIMVSMWDLDLAIDALPERWKAVVLARLDGAQLDAAEHRAYLRAVDRLTQVLNRQANRPVGDHDGPGARKAIPNARAVAITHDDRDGK